MILNSLKNYPKSTIKELSLESNISEGIIKNILDIYVESGVVDEYGFGNSKTFALSSNVYATKSEKKGRYTRYYYKE